MLGDGLVVLRVYREEMELAKELLRKTGKALLLKRVVCDKHTVAKEVEGKNCVLYGQK